MAHPGERWAKYKDNFINLSIVPSLNIQRWTKKNDGMVYSGDLDLTKGKPYVVYVNHNPIECFEKKEQAVEFCQKLIEGKYDV